MVYNREQAYEELYDPDSEQRSDMAHELIEHMESIKRAYRSGDMDELEDLIEEWGGNS
ncbi:hypothetical protein PBI_SCTP2_337 [Salicola phage SCTP-2]|nr:hypothetical protein PBI_SCTP2_337 [Salicola phage SCTP-2]